MKAILTLILFAAVGFGQGLETETTEIRGTLQVLRTEAGQSYFAVDGGREFEVESDAGGARRGSLLQLAGMTDQMLDFATEHEGETVVLTGRPFGAVTVHHYTDVLWLVESIQRAEE